MKSLLVCFLLSLSSTVFGQSRTAQVAGKFYPADPVVLADSVNDLLNGAQKRSAEFASDQIAALIVPHAGIDFSGKTAAQAYAAVEGRNYRRIFILGPAHTYPLNGAAFPSASSWSTPLGPLKIDTAIENLMMKNFNFLHVDDSAFAGEHSIEVQLPFVQKALGEVKIVPILCGKMEFEQQRMLATLIRRIYEDLNEPTLVIASSDMTHYMTQSVAADRDWRTSALVSGGNVDQLASQVLSGDIPFCGYVPVVTTMLFAEQLGASARVLGYSTSASATHDTNRVVGYGSFVFGKSYAPDPLSAQDKAKLLSAARGMLEATVHNKTFADPTQMSDRLKYPQGAFVTLTENGELRGCLGYRTNQLDLYQSVVQAAKFSATRDSRFPAVADSELSRIKIEVSAIGPLYRVRKIDEITLGRDGLYIRYGDKSGLLLPQVAKQYGWNMEEYLKQICEKAELDPSVLSKPGIELYRFTDEVFSE